MFWFKHVGCTESPSTTQTLVYANNFLMWYYNTETNTYHVTLQNSTHTRKLKANTTIIFNRWSLVTFLNFRKTGAEMMRNANEYMLSETYADIKMSSEDYIFLGSTYLPSLYRFSGYLSTFRVVSTYLSPYFIRQYGYFRSSGLNTMLHILAEVLRNDGADNQALYSYQGVKLLGTTPDMAWTEINPFCPRSLFSSDGTEYSINSNKNCEQPEKIIMFDGTFYFQPLDTNIAASMPSSISFWFKFFKNEHTTNNSTLLLYDGVFRVDYDRSGGSDSIKGSSSKIIYTHILNPLSVYLTIPRHENVWFHVICSHTSTGPLILWIGGIGKSEVSPASGNLQSDGFSHTFYIAGTTSFTYFTGSMREIIWVSEGFSDILPVVTRGKKLSKIEIESLSPYLFLTTNLEDRSYYFYYTSNGKWQQKMEANFLLIDDTNPILLCEPESVPVPDFKEKKMQCRESFVYVTGIDKSTNKLQLPAPTSTMWTTEGTICMMLFLTNTSITSTPKRLFYFNPLEITFFYSSGHLSLEFFKGATSLLSFSPEVDLRTWESLCFTFYESGGNQYFEAQETLTPTFQSSVSSTVHTFVHSGNMSFFGNGNYGGLFVKQLLLLRTRITTAQHYVLYWGNTDFLSYFGSNVIAYWPLNETGNFVDPINNQICNRGQTNEYAGPSSKFAEYILSGLEVTDYPRNMQPPPFTHTFSVSNKLAEIVPKISVSLDLADIALKGFIQSISGYEQGGIPQIRAGSVKPNPSDFSRYHGLMIFNYTSYQNYYVSIIQSIASGGISMWFYANTNVEYCLFSGWGGSTKGTVFTVHYLNFIHLKAASQTVYSIISVTQSTWHNLICFWKIGAADIVMSCILDGTTLDVMTINQPISIDSDNRVVIGTDLDTSLTIASNLCFVGYIRRVDLIEHFISMVSPADIAPMLTTISKEFVWFNVVGGVPYPCDMLSGLCFLNTTVDLVPGTASSCASTCLNSYGTSCESQNYCSICNDTNCLYCLKGLCLQCRENMYFTSSGKCECLNAASQCGDCSPLCKTCSEDNNSSMCTSCSSTLSLVPNDYGAKVLQGICDTSCPSGTKRNSQGFCIYTCPEYCLRCTSSNNLTACTYCKTGYYFLGEIEGQCVTSCPINTVISLSGTSCDYCHSTCGSCTVANDSLSCLSCSSSTPFFVYSATSSASYCVSSCSGSSTYTDVVSNICYTDGKCPINRYTNSLSMTCEACHSSCLGCSKPGNSFACKGCSDSSMYLRLENELASSGECVKKCSSKDYYKKGARVCFQQPYTQAERSEANRFGSNVNLILTLLIVFFALGFLISIGDLGTIKNILNPLQMSSLLSLVKLPQMPMRLEYFYKNLGIVSFDFFPNLISVFLPESITHSTSSESALDKPFLYHPSLQSKLFLVNIGQTSMFFMCFGIYCFVVTLLAKKYPRYEEKMQKLRSVLMHILMLVFFDVYLCGLVQSVHSNFSSSAFFIISNLCAYLGVVASFIFFGYCGYFLWKLRAELDSQDILNKYGSLYYKLKTQSWKYSFYSLFWILGIRVLVVFLMVVLESSPNAQIYSFLVIHILAVGYVVLIRPFKNGLEFVNTLFGYLGIIIVNCLYMGLNNSSLNQTYVEDLGKWVQYTIIVTAGSNIVMCIISASWDFYKWYDKSYPTIDQPHKGLQRITQKEASMEENPSPFVKQLSDCQLPHL